MAVARRTSALAAAALAVAVVARAGHRDAACGAADGGAQSCVASARDSVLLQMHHDKARLAIATIGEEIHSGERVLFRIPCSGSHGNRLTAQQNGEVHGLWNHSGSWQKFEVSREAGAGALVSGDAVFFKSKWGEYLGVNGSSVRTMPGDPSDSARFVIETRTGGPIVSGSTVFLKANATGMRVDANAPSCTGVVLARYPDMGEWQELIIERAGGKAAKPTPTPTPEPEAEPEPEPEPTAEPEPTEVLPTTAEAPPVTEAPTTTEMPTTREAADGTSQTAASTTTTATATGAAVATTTVATTSAAPCVAKGSLGKCEACLKSEQCGEGRYCCPYMKKCVADSQEPCHIPVARCQPMCWDSVDSARCSCENTDFPAKWQHPTCQGGEQPTTATKPVTIPIIDDPTRVTPTEWEHFVMINALRWSGFTCPGGHRYVPNRAPLRFDCRLWEVSRQHSEDMALDGFFSHYSRDGRSPSDRARELGTTVVAENIAGGSGTAQWTLDLLRRSEPHCRNMMNPAHKVMGVGHARGGYYRHYWTQMFRDSGDIETSCYPLVHLPVARGDDAHAHDGQRIVGDDWVAGATQAPPGSPGGPPGGFPGGPPSGYSGDRRPR